MKSWHDVFKEKLDQVRKDIDSAENGSKNGASREQIDEYLKSARILLKEASGINYFQK